MLEVWRNYGVNLFHYTIMGQTCILLYSNLESRSKSEISNEEGQIKQ